MVHFVKTKIEEMCECQYFYLHAIFQFKRSFAYNFVLFTVLHYFLKKSLSTIFFMNTVVHHLIFFTNCCPSEIIVLQDVYYFLFKVELDAQVEMQELFDVCYNQYQSAVYLLE